MSSEVVPATPSFSNDSFEREFADWIRRMREDGFEFRLQDWHAHMLPPDYDRLDRIGQFPHGRITIEMRLVGWKK